jgi:hypothetical protein
MPVFGAKLFELGLDKGRYSQTLDQAIKRQMRLGGREFARVAAAAVPLRTGFARGVFVNVVEGAGISGVPPDTPANNFLNSLRVIRKHGNILFNRKFPEVSGMFQMNERTLRRAGAEGFKAEFYTGGGGRVLKTPQSGRAFATPPSNIFTANNFVYSFNFQTTITYFNINDFFNNPHTPSSPWGAFEKGRQAFLTYLRTKGLEKLPQVQSFLTETEVNVTGATKSRTQLGVLSRAQNG